MRISRAWLSDYVDFAELSAHDLSELVTTRVAEVDFYETVAEPMESAIAALVTKIEKIPQKDKLVEATVSLGKEEMTIVCGAPNCRVGLLTAFVPVGGKIVVKEGGQTVVVQEKAVGGVKSRGVLASEAELGLTSDHSGVMEIPAELGLKPGQKLSDAIGGPDTVLEIDNKSLTHRPDLWCHFGFAREIAAILGRPLKENPDRFADNREEGQKLLKSLGSGEAKVKPAVASGTPCRRFLSVEFLNVKAEPSPLWMRRRLYSVGAGVRNILVDLSNYVMHDLGQPNHAYDADKVKGAVLEARYAKEGEIFLGLDGIERKLTEKDMVIADETGAVALAGIMGGATTAISDTTTRLVLESANFDPTVVRLSTKRHAIRTDASNRFEKSRSAYAAPFAIQRFAELMTKIQPACKITCAVQDTFPQKPEKIVVKTSCGYIRERLGTDVPDARIKNILTGLGFDLKENGADAFSVEVPHERATRDISIPDDLVEEIGRTYGYENITPTSPLVQCSAVGRLHIKQLENAVCEALCGQGFSEVYNYSFVSKDYAETCGYDHADSISLLNPIDTTQGHLRTSLVPGMLGTVQKNARFYGELYLFEIGRSYEPKIPEVHKKLQYRSEHQANVAWIERRLLSIAYSSGKDEAQLGTSLRPSLGRGGDFYALAGVIRDLGWLVSSKPIVLEEISLDSKESKKWMHPYRAAKVMLNGSMVGVIAEVKKSFIDDVSARVVVAEIDLELLLEADPDFTCYKEIPKYPDSFFEMSVVMPGNEPYAALEDLLVKSVDNQYLRRIEPLAVYTGKPLNEGEKSVSVKLFFGSDERTLSSDEIEKLRTSLMDAVNNSHYSLRA